MRPHQHDRCQCRLQVFYEAAILHDTRPYGKGWGKAAYWRAYVDDVLHYIVHEKLTEEANIVESVLSRHIRLSVARDSCSVEIDARSNGTMEQRLGKNLPLFRCSYPP